MGKRRDACKTAGRPREPVSVLATLPGQTPQSNRIAFRRSGDRGPGTGRARPCRRIRRPHDKKGIYGPARRRWPHRAAPRPGSGQHNVHRRDSRHSQGVGRTHRVRHTDGNDPVGQAHGSAHPPDSGLRAHRSDRGIVLRLLGPVRGRRLHRGTEGRGARTGAAGCGAGRTGRSAAHAGRLRSRFREEARRVLRQVGRHQDGSRQTAHRGHRTGPGGLRRSQGGDDLVRFHRDLSGRGARPPGSRDLREGPPEQRARHCAEHDLRVRRSQVRRPLRQRSPQPQRRHSGASGTRLGERRPRRRQGLQDRPDAHEDDPGPRPQGQDAGPQWVVLHEHPRQPGWRSPR